MAKAIDKDRAKKTLYVTGFNSKLTTKHLLEELFTQGGPIRDVTLFETHAYILFHHEESVPYCLALFNEIELHGHKLRISPKVKGKDVYCYMKYLMAVRKKLMSEYMKIPPPDLPQKKIAEKSPRKVNQHPKNQSRSRNSHNKSNNSGGKSKRKNNRKIRGKVKKIR